MVNKSKTYKDSIKAALLSALKEEKVFWSYDPNTITLDQIPDDQLIALTFRHLDISEIDLLFAIFPFAKIKKAWINLLIPEGDYLYTLNRFFAWYYFNIKHPDTYIKGMLTRHINNLLKQ